jgi:hypothetical protein
MSLAIFGQDISMCQQRTLPVRTKPGVQVLRLNGKTRVIGVKEAAAWLGCSQTVVRDIAIGPDKCARYSDALVARVLREYPMLKGAV